MKINKSSWHYRLAASHGSKPSENLCVYFWEVVGSIILLAMKAAVVMAIISLLVSKGALAALVFIVILMGSFAVSFLILAALIWLAIRLDKPRKVGQEGRPSLFVEYIKAKKQRICPLIEFEDRS